MKKEIIGKFAKENLYKNDTFRKEKLVNKLVKKKDILSDDNYKFNSYNIEFKLFRNPNYSLEQGDIIDIISVYPTSSVKANGSTNQVQYVASKIKVLGFLRDGKESSKAIQEVKNIVVDKKKKKKKKEAPKIIIKKAKEIVLDIDSKVLLSLIDDYNRGSQLWMVKTKALKPKKTKVSTVKQQKVTQKTKVTKPRTYPTKLYKSRDGYKNLQATIHYTDQKDAALTKKKTIKLSSEKDCKNSSQFLLAISNKVHLRTGPSNQHKIIRIVYRNYIIPHSGKVNADWYRTCDGYYIHRLEVKSIPKDLALKKLGK